MGFSVSASTAILLVAAFASVGMLYTSAANGFEQVSEATLSEQEAALETANTDIAIENVTHDTTGTTDYLNVTVVNDGSSSLHVSKTDLLVDGSYRTPETVTVNTTEGTVIDGSSETDLWLPGEKLRLSLHENVSKPFTVKVVTDDGVAASEVIT